MQNVFSSTHWWLPLILILLITPFSTSIDLSIERFFYTPQSTDSSGHFINNAFTSFFYDYVVYIAVIISIIAAIVLVLSYFVKSYKHYYKPALFLVLVMGIGGQFIIQNSLKDHWGRPRPKQVVEFGGTEAIRAWYQPDFSEKGQAFKSFVCGHCSMGFYFFVFVFLGRRLHKKWLTVFGWIAAIALGGLLGITRMMSGGHFFTDVVMAAIIMWYSALILDWLIYADA